MNIHEYQAKELFDRFEVPSPRGKMAGTAEEAEAIAKEIGSDLLVVKAQVHAGGREKAPSKMDSKEEFISPKIPSRSAKLRAR